MRDFACSKSKSKKIKKRKRRTKKRSAQVKTDKISFFNKVFIFFKGLFSSVLIFSLLALGFYLFSEPLLITLFPIKQAEHIILKFVSDNGLSRCYYFAYTPDEQRFSLASIDNQLCQTESTKALVWSAKLDIVVDRVEQFAISEASIFKDNFSVREMKKLLSILIRDNLEQKNKNWLLIKHLVQWRSVLATYHIHGKLILSKAIAKERLSSLVLSSDEQCSIGVLNATSLPGLASKVAEILENSNYLVLRISNAEKQDLSFLAESVDNSYLVSQQDLDQLEKCKLIANRLIKWLPESTKNIKNEEILSEYRSDLILILGKDTGEFIFTK